MNEKVGLLAGAVWTALSENGTMTAKELKKAAKLKSDKELYLAMGWLLREDKLTVTEAEKEIEQLAKVTEDGPEWADATPSDGE